MGDNFVSLFRGKPLWRMVISSTCRNGAEVWFPQARTNTLPITINKYRCHYPSKANAAWKGIIKELLFYIMALFSARVFQVLKRSLVLLPNGPVLLNFIKLLPTVFRWVGHWLSLLYNLNNCYYSYSSKPFSALRITIVEDITPITTQMF